MLVFAAIVPHPPILIPQIGKDNLKKIKKTVAAFDLLEEDLNETRPDVIVVISPHGEVNFDAFTINTNQSYSASFENFGDFSTRSRYNADLGFINALKSKNETKLPIQLVSEPKLDHGALKQKLQTLLVAESNKKLKNTLSEIIPSALVSGVLEIAGINGETANHSVRGEERTRLIALMKDIPLHIKGLLGADKAIVSSGGVALEEINFKTMQSRLIPNLYIIGDVLNINRPSGGYSLQLCWTTGFVSGNAAGDGEAL